MPFNADDFAHLGDELGLPKAAPKTHQKRTSLGVKSVTNQHPTSTLSATHRATPLGAALPVDPLQNAQNNPKNPDFGLNLFVLGEVRVASTIRLPIALNEQLEDYAKKHRVRKVHVIIYLLAKALGCKTV